MDITYAQLSSMGPVRTNNEDYILAYVPPETDDRKVRGSVLIIADGVGGQNDGEVASRMAAETALRQFKDTKPDSTFNALLWRMFNHANLAVYDAGMANRDKEGRMATTLTITILRNNQIGIGHVGDTRTYLVHQGLARCLTTDHTHLALHQRVSQYVTGDNAADAPLRGMLTRSVGQDMVVPIDFVYQTVSVGDFVVQCSDGLHVFVTPEELADIVTHHSPADACQRLIALGEKRGTEDNLSVQIARIDSVEQVTYYRGTSIYTEAVNPMSQELQPGQILDERFEITETVSRSGMATIFKALDRQTGKYVALKVPFMEFESDPAFYSRFLREEQIGKALDHPAILRILAVDEDKRSRPYMAMELLHGKTLDQVMHEERPLDPAKAVAYATQICAALHHMHDRGIVHRDLKPQNIMVCDDGSLRIIDFGIASAAKMRRLTFTGFSPAMGTPDYMAPEQVKGRRGDHRTDIYSLGAILYEMLTGETPFDGQNPYQIMQARVTGDPVAPRRVNPALSPELEEIVLHAMAREPWERYESAAAMEFELQNPGSVQTTGRALRLQRPQLWKTQWLKILRVCLLALLPLVIFGVIYFLAKNANHNVTPSVKSNSNVVRPPPPPAPSNH
jgi:serine/threonine-protein kinase